MNLQIESRTLFFTQIFTRGGALQARRKKNQQKPASLDRGLDSLDTEPKLMLRGSPFRGTANPISGIDAGGHDRSEIIEIARVSCELEHHYGKAMTIESWPQR